MDDLKPISSVEFNHFIKVLANTVSASKIWLTILGIDLEQVCYQLSIQSVFPKLSLDQRTLKQTMNAFPLFIIYAYQTSFASYQLSALLLVALLAFQLTTLPEDIFIRIPKLNNINHCKRIFYSQKVKNNAQRLRNCGYDPPKILFLAQRYSNRI